MAEAEHETLLALFRAAIDVERDGPDVLEQTKHRDPFGDGSFKHIQLENGFRLESNFRNRKGETISLVVGRAAE